MRLSDAEREQLVEALGRHAAEGRIELDELERRVAAVFEASSREEAAAVLADLPPLPSASPRPRRRSARGHGDADAPAPGWLPTNERFRDPRTSRIMRVWVDTGGGRHYVAEDESQPSS
jgi:Domain of unknown function (DUF1707)